MKLNLPQTLWITCLGVLSLLLGCKAKTDSGGGAADAPRLFKSAPSLPLTEVPDLASYPETIRPELATAFCIHAYKLPLYSNFDTELEYLCGKDKKPSATFANLDKLAKVVGDYPRSVKLDLEHKEGGITHGVFATVYRVPIEPKWVKSAPVFKYMSTSSLYDYVRLDSGVAEDLNETVGGDLQFGKARLFYDTTTWTPDNTSFSNQRKTELNSYQVEGGNPDIGLGAEHLIESVNNDYTVYNSITVTIGEKEGGSILLTIVRIEVKNNGYPELSEKVMSDIATAQATHVHDQLMANHSDRIIE